jgi:hypothetical protein
MTQNLRSLFVPLAAASLMLGATGSASAQQFGTYSGSTSQDQTFSLTVGDDGNGNPMLTGVTIWWLSTCSKSGAGRTTAWGVGAFQPIVGGAVTYEFRSNSLYEKFKIQFDPATGGVSGSFMGHTPEFVDITTSTTKVELCNSGKVTFSGAMQTLVSRPQLTPGQAAPVSR